MPDTTRTRIRNAVNYWKRPSSEFTDPDKKDMCETLVSLFLTNLDNPNEVKMGTYDTPGDRAHYGAYDPHTGHIHFDPAGVAHMGSISSNDSYQAASTGLHEMLHKMGYYSKHPGMLTLQYHGRTPVYPEFPFSTLNPGANSCLK